MRALVPLGEKSSASVPERVLPKERTTVMATLMVTTSYEEAVLAWTAFFVLAARCGRYVTCVNLIK